MALVVTLSGGAVAGAGTASPRSTVTSVTSTAPELPTAQWTVASRSARGVMVDFRNLRVGPAIFRAVRLRARTTLLRWHVGAIDPPRGSLVPKDAGPAIDWSTEGPAGVVAAFNGGFKVAAKAGGGFVDGVNTAPLVAGDAAIALNAQGQWQLGVWGPGFPTAGFRAVAARQNLTPLVQDGALTPLATATNQKVWGDPLGGLLAEARTGLGVDVNGNLIFVATMHRVLGVDVGRALLAAGAVFGMELDMNPFWPIVGVPDAPLHRPAAYKWELPGSENRATSFNTGWQRDFFVALAEPDSWSCAWSSRGLTPGLRGVQPQPLSKICSTPSSTTTLR